MMNRKVFLSQTATLILFVLIINLLFTGVAAMPYVKIIVKDNFSYGTIVGFNYSIVSTENETLKYAAVIMCDKGIIPTLIVQEHSFSAGETLKDEYKISNIDAPLSGACNATVLFLEPYELQFIETFRIKAVPEFYLNLTICEDSSCVKESKVFIKGEDIYLDYESDVEKSLIDATLTYPDDSTKSLNLPASIKANQIGTYDLQVTASKEGYKTISLNEQFGVIEGEADIKDSYEREGKSLFEKVKKSWIYFLIGTVLLIIIFIILFIHNKKTKKQEELINQNI